jgi:hypothetical protein
MSRGCLIRGAGYRPERCSAGAGAGRGTARKREVCLIQTPRAAILERLRRSSSPTGYEQGDPAGGAAQQLQRHDPKRLMTEAVGTGFDVLRGLCNGTSGAMVKKGQPRWFGPCPCPCIPLRGFATSRTQLEGENLRDSLTSCTTWSGQRSPIGEALEEVKSAATTAPDTTVYPRIFPTRSPAAWRSCSAGAARAPYAAHFANGVDAPTGRKEVADLVEIAEGAPCPGCGDERAQGPRRQKTSLIVESGDRLTIRWRASPTCQRRSCRLQNAPGLGLRRAGGKP